MTISGNPSCTVWCSWISSGLLLCFQTVALKQLERTIKTALGLLELSSSEKITSVTALCYHHATANSSLRGLLTP